MPRSEPFGECLRTDRLRHGYSQRSLSAKLGVTHVTIGKWERGAAVPSPVHVVAMADLYSWSPSRLGNLMRKLSKAVVS